MTATVYYVNSTACDSNELNRMTGYPARLPDPISGNFRPFFLMVDRAPEMETSSDCSFVQKVQQP